MAELIIALDLEDYKRTFDLADKLKGEVGWLKIGLQLFTRYGPDIVRKLNKLGFNIFLDLKFYDIPNTVYNAVKVCTDLNAGILSLHTQGGERMCEAALRAISERGAECLLFGVTALTSFDRGEMPGIEVTPEEYALELATLTYKWGLQGVVCSGKEVSKIKKSNPGILCLCPGIRPDTSEDDQRRTVTASAAVEAGADFLVVGRPVYAAPDPVKAVQKLLLQMHAQ